MTREFGLNSSYQPKAPTLMVTLPGFPLTAVVAGMAVGAAVGMGVGALGIIALIVGYSQGLKPLEPAQAPAA